MSRATPDDVRAINGSTLDDAMIQPFLDAASLLIDKAEACAVGNGVTDDGLKTAEAFLAAHLMELSGVGQSVGGGATKTEEKFENYSVKFAVSQNTGTGVLSTGYGTTANMMMCGCLVELDKRRPQIGFMGAA